MKKLILLAVFTLAAKAQIQTQSQVTRMFYSGSNLQYTCTASQTVAQSIFSIFATTLTSISVTSNVATATITTANAMWPGMQISVVGSNVSGLDGTYSNIATPTSTTFTFTTSGVSNGTYTTSAMYVSTNQPLLTNPNWSILVLHYTSSVLDGTYYGNPGASQAYAAICNNRTQY